jgi:hypothetical protein
VILEPQVPPVLQVPQVRQVLIRPYQVLPVQQETLVLQVLQAQKVHKDLREIKEIPGQRVLLVQRVQRDLQVLTRPFQVLLVLPELKVHKALLVRQVLLQPYQVQRVLKDPKETKVLLVPPVLKVQ